MYSLKNLTIKSFHEGLTAKKFSALEVTRVFFDHIKETDKKIGAYLSLNEEGAIKTAERVDLAISQNEPVGALAGVPIAVKDNILIKALPATAGSKSLEGHIASYSAGVIQKLKKELVTFLGKTNLDEFAMGSSTENSGFHLTRNPHDLDRVPGGSSGGSAAAVASHQAVAGLGSDTGGSVRQPAAFCGVVGLKTTYGSVSRSGLIAMASSLDQIGPIAKTVEDVAMLFRAIAGGDDYDATNSNPEYGEELLNPSLEKIRALTVGIPSEYFPKELDEEIGKAVDGVVMDLQGLKINFKKITLPHTKYALPCYYIIMPAEVSSNLARFDGIRYSRIEEKRLNAKNLREIYTHQKGEGFGTEAKRRVILGTFVLSSGYYDAYYQKAQQVRTLIKQDFDEAFKKVDVILTPVTPTLPFRIGEKISDPYQMYLSDIFTIPVNLAGLPAVSIPVNDWNKGDGSLPVGFQLIGRHFREADILGVGQYYEKIAK
ncbi:MAG: Asp-tRNA(Asn)/Glu-tRNA(Gln) amidotransferase subunit GatA [Candidatus Liptonbacteria bacterium]|nr:Asp-tRNA(Asn)/Glu-tRNA(Gln) amidotransferase subunit GatA [Candidatus Liptonbacteria bacterium]